MPKIATITYKYSVLNCIWGTKVATIISRQGSFTKNAVTAYEQAAALYAKEDKLFEAASIYEYLYAVFPENKLYQQKVITLFKQLGHSDKVMLYSAL